MNGDLGTPALLWVLFLGMLSGLASLLVFRRWSNLGELRLWANRVMAHLLEVHLFSEEPGVVMRAQLDLIAANGRILMQLWRPTFILLIPFALVFALADSFFGNTALRPGESALVTVQLARRPIKVKMAAPPGFEITSPPVEIPSDRQVVWRIHALRPGSGSLQFLIDNSRLQKQITCATGLAWTPRQRSAATLTGEPPLLSRSIQSIAVGYRKGNIFGFSWLIWFSLSSFAAAGVLVIIT